MTQALYDHLWHFSEIFSRDALERSELITMAWKDSIRMGDRSTPKLMVSHMYFRSRELKFRSAFPADEMGKSQKDAWNKPERVYLDKPRVKGEDQTIGDIVLNTQTTPLDYAITNDFLCSLSVGERAILEDLSAGYTAKEIAQRNRITSTLLKSFRKNLEAKAETYL